MSPRPSLFEPFPHFTRSPCLARIITGRLRAPKRAKSPLILAFASLVGVGSLVGIPARGQSPCQGTPTVTMSPNTPPVIKTVGAAGTNCRSMQLDCASGTITNITIISVSIQAPWLSLLGITQPAPPVTLGNGGITTGGGALTFQFDPTGLAPGCYKANWTFTESTFLLQPPPDTGYTVETNPLIFQLAVTPSSGAMLVDPVPDLLSGNAVKTSDQLQGLLTKGRTVSGVAADGVTQVIIRIDTSSPGHQFTVTLTNDQGSSGSSIIPNEDGALGMPGATSFSLGQVTVTAGSADQNGLAHAFAVYRAPLDFARPTGPTTFKTGTCQGSSKTDDQSACRSVSLQVQDVTSNTTLATLPVTIVRPPVVLIHGLWGSWTSWNSFNPLVNGVDKVDSRFHVERANYDWDVSALIASTDPQYPHGFSGAKANSMGVQYVASFVLNQITGQWFTKFKNGENPASLPVAAVQADVIAHSMGGVVARTLPLLNGFFSNTFGQGLIHKVISIDATHLGSPIANLMLDPSGGCTRRILAWGGDFFSFRTVKFSNAPTTGVSGAVGDLVGSSQALGAIAAPGPHPLPTALIAGLYTNFSSIDCNFSITMGQCLAQQIRTSCNSTGDAIATNFNGTDWPLLFGPAGNNPNDALVPQNSQLNGLTITSGTNGFIFSGLLHSPGLTKLNFTPPSVLDPASPTNPVPGQVVSLLNTPYTQPAYVSLNP